MRRILNIIRSDDVPLMSRPNFIIERRHLMAWGMFSGIVEGNISTIVVLKTFHGSEFLATTVWSICFERPSRRATSFTAAPSTVKSRRPGMPMFP